MIRRVATTDESAYRSRRGAVEHGTAKFDLMLTTEEVDGRLSAQFEYNTDLFDDPNLPGEMVTTVSLREVPCGTELNIVQEGIPEAIPLEGCYLGWQESLTLLAQLVEAEIPG